ncbi:hypothetical protein GCM10027184_72030 [Saccharothrix stipae]
MFGSGTPIGTGPVQSGRAAHSVEFTVASVRPYAATTRNRRAHRAISSVGTVSVPTTSTAPSGSSHSGGSAATSDGGRIMCVASCAAM